MMTNSNRRTFQFTVPALMASALLLSACKDKAPAAETGTPTVQMIGPDNISVAATSILHSGPAITGTLIADREARIRAEVSGAVLQTYVDAGQTVSQGTVLARIDDAVLQDAALSARSMLTQASVSADQAARELGRAKTLVAAGAIAERDVEAAERANVSAQAQLADAKSRVSTVEKNVRNATVRAPFAGVVAEKSVSPGDVVSPGAALFTVIDPRSLRLSASVPTTSIADVRVGSPVIFTVNGSDRELHGKVTRVSPTVDPVTRQVSLQASLPNEKNALVAGLFVEGRVASDSSNGILVPAAAVMQTGIVPFVMRLKGGKVEKVEVQLGLQDNAKDVFEIRSGIAAGDTVLLGAARGISVGTPVAVSAPKDASPSAAKSN